MTQISIASSRFAPGMETGCGTFGRSALTRMCDGGYIRNTSSSMTNSAIPVTPANWRLLKSLNSFADLKGFHSIAEHNLSSFQHVANTTEHHYRNHDCLPSGWLTPFQHPILR